MLKQQPFFPTDLAHILLIYYQAPATTTHQATKLLVQTNHRRYGLGVIMCLASHAQQIEGDNHNSKLTKYMIPDLQANNVYLGAFPYEMANLQTKTTTKSDISTTIITLLVPLFRDQRKSTRKIQLQLPSPHSYLPSQTYPKQLAYHSLQLVGPPSHVLKHNKDCCLSFF